MKPQRLLLILAGLAALIAGLAVQRFGQDWSVPAGHAMPVEFSLPDTAGRMQAVSQWRGKVLVINFWATWCPPCLQELPEFIRLQNEYGPRGLQFIGVAIDEPQPVSDFALRLGVNYPMLLAGDTGIGLSQRLGNVLSAVPFTVIVNRAGLAEHVQPGEISRARLLELVKPLLEAERAD